MIFGEDSIAKDDESNTETRKDTIMEVVKTTTNEVANKVKAITLDKYNNIPDRQSYIKNIATLLAVCKEYGYRFSIDENEFFDFIDVIIKRFKDEESVVIVTASEKDLLTMVKEKLRVIKNYAHNSIAVVDDTIEKDGYIIYRVGLDKESNSKYNVDLAISLLDTKR